MCCGRRNETNPPGFWPLFWERTFARQRTIALSTLTPTDDFDQIHLALVGLFKTNAHRSAFNGLH